MAGGWSYSCGIGKTPGWRACRTPTPSIRRRSRGQSDSAADGLSKGSAWSAGCDGRRLDRPHLNRSTVPIRDITGVPGGPEPDVIYAEKGPAGFVGSSPPAHEGYGGSTEEATDLLTRFSTRPAGCKAEGSFIGTVHSWAQWGRRTREASGLTALDPVDGWRDGGIRAASCSGCG